MQSMFGQRFLLLLLNLPHNQKTGQKVETVLLSHFPGENTKRICYVNRKRRETTLNPATANAFTSTTITCYYHLMNFHWVNGTH